jgi:hypothetical protein
MKDACTKIFINISIFEVLTFVPGMPKPEVKASKRT